VASGAFTQSHVDKFIRQIRPLCQLDYGRPKKEEEERRRKKSQGKNIMVCPIT